MLLALRVGVDLAALGVLVVLARRSAPHLARGAGWKVAVAFTPPLLVDLATRWSAGGPVLSADLVYVAALVMFTARTRGQLWRTLPEELLRDPAAPRLTPRFREVALLLLVWFLLERTLGTGVW